MDPVVLPALPYPARTPASADRVQALDKHQRADDPREHHIAEPYDKIDLPHRPQCREDLHPERCAESPASQQDQTHFQIRCPAPDMRQRTRA